MNYASYSVIFHYIFNNIHAIRKACEHFYQIILSQELVKIWFQHKWIEGHWHWIRHYCNQVTRIFKINFRARCSSKLSFLPNFNRKYTNVTKMKHVRTQILADSPLRNIYLKKQVIKFCIFIFSNSGHAIFNQKW